MRPIGPSGSTAPDDVVPTVATAQAGFQPAARSPRTAFSKASGIMVKWESMGMRRRFSFPYPAILTPFSTLECVSAVA